MTIRTLRLGLSLALFLAAGVAEAAPRQGARLVWARGEGADTCVGITGLTEDVKMRLGWDPFELPLAVDVEGAVHRTPKGFRASVSFRSADGKSLGNRELESHDADCRSLGEAVAVAITVVIDPDASGTRLPLAVETPPETIEPPPPPPPAQPPNAPHVRATLNGGASGWLLPSFTATTSLRVGVLLDNLFEVGVGAAYFPESRQGDFGFGLATGEARGCFVPRQTRGVLRFCGAALVGVIETYVHSDERKPVDVGVFPWLGAEAGTVLSVPVFGPARIELGVGALIPVLRRTGVIRGASKAVWEQYPVAGRAELGIGMLF